MANILVVEDDRDLNEAYQMILRREHHNVEAVFNGEQALVKLQTFIPDLVLLDLLMPVKSGVDFLKDYDIRFKHPEVRVVVFTNLENSPEINEAFGLGAYKCVIKSWTAPQGLVKVVEDVLNGTPEEALAS
ncbi:MAG TPA: response regulator [Candidatus Binatia bacterium]|jgi:DNA-binding NtrC family response regulator|nr:response regulator [Candidatus Binatia bacterium]